jgi:hypothetical protein
LKADSLAVLDGKPRDPHGPEDELGNAESADGLNVLIDGFPIGDKAVETPTERVAMAMDEKQMEAFILKLFSGI